jgi:hypothetical protein
MRSARRPLELCTGRLEAALEAEELSDEFVGVLAAYRCTRCGAWHIGRMTLDKFREMLSEIKTLKEN